MLNKLVFTAGTLESVALGLLAADRLGNEALLRFYLVHALASVFVSLAVWASLPAGMRQPRKPMLLFGFVANLTVPGLPVMMRVALFIGARFRRLLEDAPVAAIKEPEYSIYRSTEGMQARGGRTRTKLTNLKVPVSERLAALLAIQETPARASADLLRQLLADPIEDIRLLAYGMLDGKEKSIGVRILAEEGKLEKLTDDKALYGCHKRLSELYWELSYQRLVQGDMLRYACQQARSHAEHAVAIDTLDSGLWFMLLRIALELREPDKARVALNEAQKLGFAAEQLIPYQAELAFMERRLADIPALLGQLRNGHSSIRVATIAKFWTDNA